MIPDHFSSERLEMRPMALSDAEALHEAYRDSDLMRWWSSGPHTSLQETRDYIAPRVGHAEWQAWTVARREDGQAIGTLSAGVRRPNVYEIGYLLVRDSWGQGFAREAIRALLSLIFTGKGARRVYADTDPENVESIALLEKLGFQREGVLRGDWETHLGVRDALILGLLRDEWQDAALP